MGLSRPERVTDLRVARRGHRRLRAGAGRLPPWPEAARSADALGFGNRERYGPFLSALYDNLGVGLMRAERLEACAVAIERALALAAERSKFHHNLGLCHFHGRRYAQSVDALRAARAAGEKGAIFDYNLGRALALAGRCPRPSAS